jgi:hypothetical protein
MESCIQSAIVSSACLMCGGRAEKMHRPLFHRGTFCPRCCPACAPRPVAAPAAAASGAAPRAGATVPRGATQWTDAGWGPRSDDPWYRDDERREVRPRWVPQRPHWFR